MYFFHAPIGRMLAIAGLRGSTENMNERKKGALVVREILGDHSLGPVYLLRPPTEGNANKAPAAFESSSDAGFVQACRELLANKPFLEQSDYGNLLDPRNRMKWHDLKNWSADEPSRGDFANRFGKAMSFYHRKNGALVAVMKWGWVMISRDEGSTWSAPIRPASLVAGMAKVWGQRTGDGRYALLYNPDLAERFPLVIVTGDDGITFGDMRVVHGELPPMRYPGLSKVIGPQYVRGISEWSSDGSFADCARAIWVCYSMSKEDIWVSRIPVGGGSKSTAPTGFSDEWNLYCPAWAPIMVERETEGTVAIEMEDRDPFDYARATRLFPASHDPRISFEYRVEEPNSEPLQVELRADKGASILCFSSLSEAVNRWNRMELVVDGAKKIVAVSVNGAHVRDVPIPDAIKNFHAISFRTGERQPAAATEQDRPVGASRYRLKNLSVRERE
jgi:hypothetical protein